MIWNVHKPEKVLSDHLSELISDTCASTGLHTVLIQDVACGVAEFCMHQFPSLQIPSDYLALLVSKSLWSVGEALSGELFIREYCTPDLARACIPFDRSPDEMKKVWRLCAARALRSSSWATRSDSLMWVVDLRKICWGKGQFMELAMHQGLLELIEPLASVWDTTSGRGELGLIGMSDQAGQMLNQPPRSKALQPFIAEMHGLCEDLLDGIACRRGWSSRPEVINLSL